MLWDFNSKSAIGWTKSIISLWFSLKLNISWDKKIIRLNITNINNNVLNIYIYNIVYNIEYE